MFTLRWLRPKPAVVEPYVQPTQAEVRARFPIHHDVRSTAFVLHLAFATQHNADSAGQSLYGHPSITSWHGGDSWAEMCEPAQEHQPVALHIEFNVNDQEWDEAVEDATSIAVGITKLVRHYSLPGLAHITRADDWSAAEWPIEVASTNPTR